MGCGCGKSKSNRGQRLKKAALKRTQAKQKALSSKRVKLSASSSLTSKSSMCMSCIESKQSPSDRKKGIRVCRKCNRLINNIIRDRKFICPLGKWKNPNP